MVLSCLRCQADLGQGAAFQNKRHGSGMRVHNETRQIIASKRVYRCTICNTERTKGR